jgi:hypothetical protein
VSWRSKRLLYIRRHVFEPIPYFIPIFHLKIHFVLTLKSDQDQIRTNPYLFGSLDLDPQ